MKKLTHLTVEGLVSAIDEALFDIDETNLTQEYAQQASMYASLAVMVATAERDMARAAVRKDEMYAECDADYRKELDAKEKKYTEAVIKGKVLLDIEYAKTCADEIEAKYRYRVLRAAVDAASQRADMLISMGAHLRAELTMTGMSIKEKQLDDSIKEMKQQLKERK